MVGAPRSTVKISRGTIRTWIAIFVLAVLCSSFFIAPFIAPVEADGQKPPQDSGIAGLQQELRKLQTTARLLHTVAHPDDEDGGMLALQSRGVGADVMLFTLNRGEGGQNKTGKELFDSLGVLRTLELLKADEYYGASERFSRVVDFGFSKNPEETFQHWDGHGPALEDMVRTIRIFRPDVLVSRFQGAPRDGHGHHQAAGILTKEAFKAAADPLVFPNQISEGLLPWQAKKLYMDNVKPSEDYTLNLDTGAYDPALGMSYLQFALEGLSHQLSQGSGGIRVSPGHHYSYYKLLESTVPTPGTSGGHENSFFDGIDTSLAGLVSRAGPEAIKIPFLAPGLDTMTQVVSQAVTAFTPDNPARAATPLLAGLKIARDLINQIKTSDLSAAAKTDLLANIETKRDQFERAANLALGIALDVAVDAPAKDESQPVGFPGPESTFAMAVPGQTFTVTAHFYNRSPRPVTVDDIWLDLPNGWQSSTVKKDLKTIGANEEASEQFQITVPPGVGYTRPYWHRDNPQTESIYKIDDPRYITLPFPPPPIRAGASYSLAGAPGEIDSIAQVKYVDPLYGQGERPLVIGPALSVEVQPPDYVIPTDHQQPYSLSVGVRNNVAGPASGTLRLEVPEGWHVEPAAEKLSFAHDGDFESFKFAVTPGSTGEGRYQVKAVAESEGRRYAEGYTVISRHDLDTFYYYQPAVEKVSAVAFKSPQGLKVGYIMGAGDDIPETLRQLGLNVQIISDVDLAAGDLSKFDTIIMGIRAYDVRSDVRDNNKRLLEYVSKGGTLIVQYNQTTTAFNNGGYTPYPATASAKRVTVEEAPVQILEPQDSIFHYPNEITAKDFDGWVQERGVYFMEKWDPRYKALLASNDPGEQPLAGGLLTASYGKGTYVYTGYAFFRQLPAGVPGAIRLFINILAAGHQPK
jgi:LmbE family N-acetylglucosaminyl deacetylase